MCINILKSYPAVPLQQRQVVQPTSKSSSQLELSSGTLYFADVKLSRMSNSWVLSGILLKSKVLKQESLIGYV